MKSPHIVLSVVWFIWYGNVIAALALPGRPLYGLIVLLTFLPIEAIGVFRDTGTRDTLSEISTWVFHRLSKHRRLRGWNALLLLIVITIAYLFGRTAYHLTGFWPVAVVTTSLMIVWLYDHWLDPQTHG